MVIPADPSQLNTILLDLATHPHDCWAVVFNGQILPVRFVRASEASKHLADMIRGTVVMPGSARAEEKAVA